MNHEVRLPEDGLSDEQLEILGIFDKLSGQVYDMLSGNYRHYLTIGTRYTPELVVDEVPEGKEFLKLSLFQPSLQTAYSPALGAVRFFVSHEDFAKSKIGEDSDEPKPELMGKSLEVISVKRNDLVRQDRPPVAAAAGQELSKLDLAVAQYEFKALDLSTVEAKQLGFSDYFIRSRLAAE